MSDKRGESQHIFQGAVFGIVDGFIMMVGIVPAIVEATSNKDFVILIGVLTGFADCFANAVGFSASELAERGLQISDRNKGRTHVRVHSMKEVVLSGFLSFITTLLALLVPLIPFLFIDIIIATMISVTVGFIALFLLGLYVGKLSNEPPTIMGLRYLLLGVIGAVICYFIGAGAKAWLIH
jgi:predicted membrane protein (TIGR00267 family)